MASFDGKFGGSNNGDVHLMVDVQVVTQDPTNNRTLIQYNAWIERRGTTSAFNNSATSGNTNINGYNPSRLLGSYNFGSTSRYNLAVNEQYWIGHDANGDANPFFGANYDLSNSPLLTTASCGGNVAMPHISRAATITAFNFPTVSDSTISFNWSADVTCDYISWWSTAYDGGGHHDIPASGTGPFSVTLSNLVSTKTYDFTVSVRRADSGVWTNSSTVNQTTLGQNNFMDLGGL